MVGIYASLVYLLLYHPGYIHHPTHMVWYHLCTPAASPQPVVESWAQVRRNPWVRAPVRVKVLKGVMREGGLCAELLRSSGWIR